MFLITAVVMTPHCWGGDGVAEGASFVIFTTDHVIVTVLCGVGADSSLHTATSLLYEGIFQPDTATVTTGIAGIVSYVSAVMVGVITATLCYSPLVTVLTVFMLVGG